MEGVILHNASDDCLAVKVFPEHDLQVLSFVGLVLSFLVYFKTF